MQQLILLDLSGKETDKKAEIQWMPIELLSPHPDNPRLIYRDEIIDTIAQGISKEGFQPEYALLVRPFSNSYQIISGHTRHKAAVKVGCKFLPCWVKEMDDDEAFMQLVLANNQGELSPLEIGIHALKAVPLCEGGRGKTGGLSEYARAIGKAKGTISPYRDAAKVFNSINCSDIQTVLDKASHLSAISKAPESEW